MNNNQKEAIRKTVDYFRSLSNEEFNTVLNHHKDDWFSKVINDNGFKLEVTKTEVNMDFKTFLQTAKRFWYIIVAELVLNCLFTMGVLKLLNLI